MGRQISPLIHASKNEVENLVLFETTEGNPAEKMMETHLADNPTFSITELKNIARSLKRNDLIQYLQAYPEDLPERFSELTDNVKNEIFFFINITQVNWKRFAGKMEYGESAIAEFAGTSDRSPTDELFRLMRERCPELTLEELANHLKKIKQIEACNYVKTLY